MGVRCWSCVLMVCGLLGDYWYVVFFFFFQAEDGIRDLVRSRGLGDVYKRQAPAGGPHIRSHPGQAYRRTAAPFRRDPADLDPASVSYTHLTLPTIYSV